MNFAEQIMLAAKRAPKMGCSARDRSAKKELTGPECAAIRRRNAAGESMKNLAEEYGVSFKQVADCFI